MSSSLVLLMGLALLIPSVSHPQLPHDGFTPVTTGPLVSDEGDSRGASWREYDNDGDLDLFVASHNDQNNFLYANNGNANHWINLQLAGDREQYLRYRRKGAP